MASLYYMYFNIAYIIMSIADNYVGSVIPMFIIIFQRGSLNHQSSVILTICQRDMQWSAAPFRLSDHRRLPRRCKGSSVSTAMEEYVKTVLVIPTPGMIVGGRECGPQVASQALSTLI